MVGGGVGPVGGGSSKAQAAHVERTTGAPPVRLEKEDGATRVVGQPEVDLEPVDG